MDLQQLLADYGYLALVVGTFFEGETILVLGGFAANRGYLDLRLAILAAFVGSVLGDQFWFFLGRRLGARLVERRPTWRNAADRIERGLRRHRDLFIFGFRFLYGLRMVSPFVIAISRVSLARFTVLNVLGALVWAISFGIAGYVFGHSVELLLGRVQRFERPLFLGLIGGGLVVLMVRWWRARRRVRAHGPDQPPTPPGPPAAEDRPGPV
ncbi:MAG: DedA family protein [Planctomycetes bacterium]|nr:DedA family protein [Planctomycetota bacterium]